MWSPGLKEEWPEGEVAGGLGPRGSPHLLGGLLAENFPCPCLGKLMQLEARLPPPSSMGREQEDYLGGKILLLQGMPSASGPLGGGAEEGKPYFVVLAGVRGREAWAWDMTIRGGAFPRLKGLSDKDTTFWAWEGPGFLLWKRRGGI